MMSIDARKRRLDRAIGAIRRQRPDEARAELLALPLPAEYMWLWAALDDATEFSDSAPLSLAETHTLRALSLEVCAVSSIPSALSFDAEDISQILRLLDVVPTPQVLSLTEARAIQMWALVALAALARAGDPARSALQLLTSKHHAASQFAYSVGFQHAIHLVTAAAWSARDTSRTIPITRFADFSTIERLAYDTANRILPGEVCEETGETRRTLTYVIVELLRNTLQHSQDPHGGVFGVQRQDTGPYQQRPVIQVAVADAGIGIERTLRGMHPTLKGPQDALEKSLWPHFSSAFAEGMSGTPNNAGMGLFFISEMTKLNAGRLLVASRGAALYLEASPDADDAKHRLRFLQPPQDLGFPGTLVVFEVPEDSVKDHDQMIKKIHERAEARAPQRQMYRWIRYEDPRQSAAVFAAATGAPFVVRVLDQAEDTPRALETGREMTGCLFARRPIILDFDGVDVCTQSYLNSLLFESLRVAWALRLPMYVINARDAVRSGIELVERYALGG